MPTPKTQSSIASAITDSPVLVAPESENLFGALVQELVASEDFNALYDACATSAPTAQEDDDFWDDDDPWVAAFRPYTVVNGVLQIPIYGALLNRFSFQFGRRATGYQYIERAFNRGMADHNVRAIAFIHDSPGGEVAGNFELVEKIVARRGEKPMRAFAADHAYSASYSLATAADSIIMSRSGGVGSVGVVVAHVEMSEMLKDWGIKVTFIHAGKYKVDGNSYEKLSDSAKERIQTRVDRIYGEFTALVAGNRGMEEQAVRDTEALTYDASEAIEIGFADKVGAFEEELAAFAEEADETENELMAVKPNTPTAAPAADGQITQAQLDAAVAEAKAEGHAEGVQAERDRVNAIMGSEEAKERPVAAAALAESGSTVEMAKATLAKLPVEKAEEPAPAPAPAKPEGSKPTPFGANMDADDHPTVGADADEDGGNKPSISEQMLAAYGAVSGYKRPVN